MGVHNLWELLAPVGRRVSVETLSGKKVAIDASIWIVQFMKAMRDEKGEMVRNAHLIGFFRRICKLLFLRTKPVFVFDGGTPALKRRTVIARRRQRENAQTKIRKTAEKLLMNQLKAMKLKQLAEDIKNQKKESDVKGKKVLSDQPEFVRNILERNDAVSGSYNQEKLDEMLAASLAAEEDGSFTGNASTSSAGIPLEDEEDDDDEDEEMILPTMHGKVDPAVLASLPPSMQLDLLVQMRERLMAENRQKYQKVKKAPAKFSELQIQSYLKTVAFRREIDEVQKSAAGRGAGGVQTSRIASESNREFIFSSSFTGDKEAFTSTGAERSGNKQHQTRSDCYSGSLDSVASSVKTSTATRSVGDESGGVIENDVETYMDDRGHLRVSRVRAMGIRMTRDLQRNLDMMKEMEQERSNTNTIVNSEASIRNVIGAQRSFSSNGQFPGTSDGAYDETDNMNNRNQQSGSKNEVSIEISFERDGEHKCSDADDDLFARLVAGDQVIISSVDNTSLRKQSPGSTSECDWEDGIVDDKASSLTNDVNAEMKPSLGKGNISDESEVEWEEGVCDIPKTASPRPAEFAEAISRGCQEETDMQEAIRRSLEELKGKKCVDASSENENRKKHGERAHEYPSPNFLFGSFFQQNEPICETLTGVDKQDGVIGTSIPMIINASGSQLASPIKSKSDNLESLVGKSCEGYSRSHSINLPQETHKLNLSSEKLVDASSEGGEVTTFANSCQVNGSCVSDSMLNNVRDAIPVDACKDDSKDGKETADLVVPFGDYSAKQALINLDVEQKLADERDHNSFFVEREHSGAEVTEATLEEEMLVLGQEYINLGDEQRKNERNVESVSSEMFAECQELLQMFGLPYIIAPMEAEAQCAFMELANLVDGVVTDDSDVFLFGARNVYKNIFDDRKYVETYFMKDIENELGLSRDKLIRMALLLGSDYTEGISGIGIVNAIEVVNAFPEGDGLHKFREWIESPDPNILGKFQVQKGSSSRKRGSSANENDVSRSDGNVEGVSASDHNQVYENEQSMDNIEEIKQIFMDKHRNVSKNWHIPSSFPSEAVISAYASPQVDKSTEPFAWGKPDLFVLRKLCWGKFGWSSQKADELLLPVLKEYNKHETQLRLEAFYTFNERFAKVRSKRIKKAVKGITGNQSLELQDGSAQAVSNARKRRRVGPIQPGVNRSEKLLLGTDNDVARKESNSIKSLSHQGEGEVNVTPSMEGKAQPPKRAVGRGSVRNGSSGNRRNRGRGRRQQGGKGGGKGSPVFDSAKSSSSDGSSSNNEHEVHAEKLEEPREVRRSTRSRKPVYYTVNDLEYDDTDEALDQGDEECVDKQAGDQEPSRLPGDAPVGPIGINQHKIGDSLHYEIGSVVCMDEDEIGELSVSHNGDPSVEAEFSIDYLKMGGGFCMDESETNESPSEQANDIAAANTDENTDCCRCDFVDKTEQENHLIQSVYCPEDALNGLQDGGKTEASDTVQHVNFPNATPNAVSNLVVPTQENTKDHTSTPSVRALSAMPFLRRKRREC